MNPHLSILSLWPSRAELHRDLVALGYSITAMGVVRWGEAERGIPPEWYVPVSRAAAARGIPSVSAELLHDLERRRGGKPDPASGLIHRTRKESAA